MSILLKELEQWNYFVKALGIMSGPLFHLFFLLYSLFYVYCLIGIELYGGKINSKMMEAITNPMIIEDADTDVDFIWLNFNDFASGMMFLFSFMIGNDWQFLWKHLELALQYPDFDK